MSVSKDMKCPHSGGSRPSDKGGGGGRGEGDGLRTQKKEFFALWASVWSKNMGGGGQVPQVSPQDPSQAHFGQ